MDETMVGPTTHADDHDCDAQKSLPADKIVQRYERQDDLKRPRPGIVPKLCELGNTHCVNTLQVDNVAGRSS